MADRAETGIELIAQERNRQVAEEGWTPEHDDQHGRGELAKAAECYARLAANQELYRIHYRPDQRPNDWPWSGSWWKPTDDPVRNLVKAGALIAAEIDRLQRRGRVPMADRAEKCAEEIVKGSWISQRHVLDQFDDDYCAAGVDGALQAATKKTAAIIRTHYPDDRELLEAARAFHVIAVALAEPSGGEYWSAGELATEWEIYHDDLDGERVLLRIAEEAEKRLRAAIAKAERRG